MSKNDDVIERYNRRVEIVSYICVYIKLLYDIVFCLQISLVILPQL